MHTLTVIDFCSTILTVHVAVPCRNQRLFRRAFRSHCCVQSAISLNFRWGSYALRRLIRYSYIYEARMSPALNGNSAIRHFKHSDAIEIRDGIIFDFYMGLSHMYVYIISLSVYTMLTFIPLSLDSTSHKWHTNSSTSLFHQPQTSEQPLF